MGFKCKDCGKDLFKRGDAYVEESRKAPVEGAPPYPGERRQVPPAPPAPPRQDPPKREHVLNRRLFGGKKKEGATP
jgi:hypothetical protein